MELRPAQSVGGLRVDDGVKVERDDVEDDVEYDNDNENDENYDKNDNLFVP